MQQALLIASAIFFATGVFLGFFVTGFIVPAPESWWIPAAVRVAWQLGGPLSLAAVIVHANGGGLRSRATWATLGGFALFGALFCFNPLLDLVAGPLDVRGRLEVDIYKSSKSIFADVTIHAADGTATTVEPFGWGVNVVEDALAACDGKDTRVVALGHLDAILLVDCGQ